MVNTQLYQGDCLEVMKDFTDNSINILSVSSRSGALPPYLVKLLPPVRIILEGVILLTNSWIISVKWMVVQLPIMEIYQ